MTQIAVVDDHEIVALAFESALAEHADLTFVGIAPTVDDLLARDLRPDLVVLDLRLADGSSPLNNVRRLDQAGLPVLVLTSGEDPYLVRLAARTDVRGVLRKSTPVPVLVEALRKAAAGHPVMSTEWAAAVDSDPELGRAALSPQEQQVLTLFARGAKAQVVASELGIAVTTVDDYVRRVRAKYERMGRPARTKVDLYKRALEDGFLPLPHRA